MKYGFVIPVYNHGNTLESVVQNLLPYDFPIIIVDDGNNEENKALIRKVDEKYPLVTLVTREKNGGKGCAFFDGLYKAKEIGLTHVLQIDSDGQHDSSKVNRFIELSKENSEAIICGCPEYDSSAPKTRVNGRKVANGWIHIVTLSNKIKDGMIGFRIYPVDSMIKVKNRTLYMDGRMGFDIEVLVRMCWAKVPIVCEPVKVFYPEDGISNYRYFRDTVRISFTYARLCIGMIVRLPILLIRNIKTK